MRVYPETRLVKHLVVVNEGSIRYAMTGWDGASIYVYANYIQAEARWLHRPYIIIDLPADELLAHELRHVHQFHFDGVTSANWPLEGGLMEADAYAEIARYRERKSQQPK